MTFEDGNYVGAGQWRALALSEALRGKIHPTMVLSIDPAQSFALSASLEVSYVRPSLTVLPYVIANDLPYRLAASFSLGVVATDPTAAAATRDFLFTGGMFSHQTILMAWEHEHLPALVTALLESYGSTQVPPAWPSTDYDTIWRVVLDKDGNLTIDNTLCEGIDSGTLPPNAPTF